jgi:hypothetical protein
MDNNEYFRTLWLTLKKSRPRLRKVMDDLECDLGGAFTIKPKGKPEKKDERSEFQRV